MSEQSYYFLSTYNLLTAIYSRYLWTKVSPCGQGIRALCGRREIFVRTKIWRPATEILRRGERAEKTGEKPRISRRTKVTSDALTPLSPHSSPLLGMREPPTDGFGEHLRILCRS